MGPFQPPRYTEAFRPGNVEELRFRSFKDRPNLDSVPNNCC